MTFGVFEPLAFALERSSVTWTALLLALLCLAPTSFSASAIAQQDEARKEPLAPQRQEAKRPGQADFDRVCKVCHGPEGRGDAGPRLVPFTREYEELLGIVREGTGQMPPISARQLPDEGVAEIVAYLKSL
jgi:mono/diheme cytochrome c family protein